jgi:hypothetical protein
MKDILNKHSITVLKKALQTIKKNILNDLKVINKLNKDEVINLLIKYNYDISLLPPLKVSKAPKPKAPPKEPKPKAPPKPKEPKPKAPPKPKEPKILSDEIKLKRELKIYPNRYFYNIDKIIENLKNSRSKMGQKDGIMIELDDLENLQIKEKEKLRGTRDKSVLLKERINKFLKYNEERINKATTFLKSL